jgi:hypothetical protein
MPAYGVTVTATFRATADQLAVEAAQSAIESASYTVAQATANTSTAVRTWLASRINSLLSGTGITVSTSDITISGFTAATAGTAGTPSGTNGSFSFRVSLSKGGSSATASTSGTITATAYVAPPTCPVTIAAMTNGTVTASPSSAQAGTNITLTVVPAAGYELNTISAYKTGDMGTPVETRLIASLQYEFTMPASAVTVVATFSKTQAQLDSEAVAAAKAAIEGGSYRVAQATANDAASVRSWLMNTLNVLFGQSHGIALRAAIMPVTGGVTVTDLTPAIAGTEAVPAGVNGSFKFTVTLTRGASDATATFTDGVIVATPHASTPVKRIELLSGNLTVRILNTGNVATGDLTLALSGANADVFTLPATTVSSLATGGETDITLTPRTGLAAGTYTATLTVSAEGMTSATVEIIYTVTPTGIDAFPQAKVLKAWTQNGRLHVNGLTVGKPWSVYGISGALIRHSVADSDEAAVLLPERGMYIVTSGNESMKVMY